MLVFIDESGDPGFKLERGSTPIFAAAMVTFANSEDARATAHRVRHLLDKLRAHPEFKFNKSSDERRDAFFNGVADCPFRVRAIVVEKRLIWSSLLKANEARFYEFFVKQMLKHDDGHLQHARIRIDGSGDRRFRKKLGAELRRHQRANAIEEIVFKDSRRDPLLQLADMAVGAIARSFRTDRNDATRWRDLLAHHINDVWKFR